MQLQQDTRDAHEAENHDLSPSALQIVIAVLVVTVLKMTLHGFYARFF